MVSQATPGGWFGKWSSSRTVADIANSLERHMPNVWAGEVVLDAHETADVSPGG